MAKDGQKRQETLGQDRREMEERRQRINRGSYASMTGDRTRRKEDRERERERGRKKGPGGRIDNNNNNEDKGRDGGIQRNSHSNYYKRFDRREEEINKDRHGIALQRNEGQDVVQGEKEEIKEDKVRETDKKQDLLEWVQRMYEKNISMMEKVCEETLRKIGRQGRGMSGTLNDTEDEKGEPDTNNGH